MHVSTSLAIVSAVLLAALTLPDHTTDAAVVRKHFCYTSPTLLSGSFHSCVNLTDPTCVGGIGSAQAYVRDFENRGERTAVMFPIDQLTNFVQMHRLSWDVNKLYFDRFGWRFWTAEPSAFGDTHSYTILRDADMPGLATNLLIPPSSQWAAYARRAFVDPHTGIGMIALLSTTQVQSYEWRASAVAALNTLARTSGLKHVIVFEYNSVAMGAGNYTALVRELQSISPIKIDAFFSVDGVITDEIATTINGTYVATLMGTAGRSGTGNTNLACMDFDTDTATNSFIPFNYSKHDLTAVPAALKTADYYADMNFSHNLAQDAIRDDPTMGYTSAMPTMADGLTRPCMGGQCAMGSLWTDSYIWKLDVDVAFQNSAGVRGPGWPAGPVKVSDLWASMPWANTLCNATLRGLSIWEMMNHSFSMPLSTTYYAEGQWFLQMAGMRVTYNMDLTPTRLVAIDVYNKVTKLYEPLDRLKLYKVAIPNYECFWLPPYSTIMNGARYSGEKVADHHETTVIHSVVDEYLRKTTTASTPKTLTWSDRTVTSALTVAMNWYSTQASCGKNTYWDAPVATCQPCPEGEVQPKSGQTTCKPKSDSTIIIAIVVPIALVLIGVVVVLGGFAAKGAAGARNVANAPKEGEITVMFTDIQDSTKLWSTVPVSMNESLDKHHHIIREAIAKHGAYEVKTAGDSFMIACGSANSAVELAMDIQREFQAAVWAPCVGKVYAAQDENELDAIDDAPGATPIPDDKFNGLRVRIGMHTGEPNVVFDDVTKGYDYYGPMVNVAARVEGITFGGQVCCTNDTLTSLGNKPDVAIRSIGVYHLKGVSEPVEANELLPTEMKEKRYFVNKNTEAFGSPDEADNDGGEDNYETASLHSGMSSHVSSDADIAVGQNFHFFIALMRVVNKSDVLAFRKTLLSAWRITDDQKVDSRKVTDQDSALSTLCRRVTMISSKAMKRNGTLQRGRSGMLDNPEERSRRSSQAMDDTQSRKSAQTCDSRSQTQAMEETQSRKSAYSEVKSQSDLKSEGHQSEHLAFTPFHTDAGDERPL